MNMGGTVGQANPSDGTPVLVDPFSGVAGSPLDNDQPGNTSTGALSTGIGFGATADCDISATSDENFVSNYVPGVTMPDGTQAPDARLVAIGGGRTDAHGVNDPWSVAAIGNFGGGGERDGGDGTVYAGVTVVADGTVPDGDDIKPNIANRSGRTLSAGESTLGVARFTAPKPVL